MPPMLAARSFASDGSGKDKRARGWETLIGDSTDPVGSTGAVSSLRPPISSKYGTIAVEAGAGKLSIHSTSVISYWPDEASIAVKGKAVNQG